MKNVIPINQMYKMLLVLVLQKCLLLDFILSFSIWSQAACQSAAAFCKNKGKDISKLAMQYSLSNKDISTILVGMKSVEQVRYHLPCFFIILQSTIDVGFPCIIKCLILNVLFSHFYNFFYIFYYIANYVN